MLSKMKEVKLVVIMTGCVLLTGGFSPANVFGEDLIEAWAAGYNFPADYYDMAFVMGMDSPSDFYVTGYIYGIDIYADYESGSGGSAGTRVKKQMQKIKQAQGEMKPDLVW